MDCFRRPRRSVCRVGCRNRVRDWADARLERGVREFYVEFRLGGCGKARLLLRQLADAATVDAVLEGAKARALSLGADTIVVTNTAGRVLGVFPTHE